MAQQTINIGDTGAQVVSDLNANFTELYGNLVSYTQQACSNNTTTNVVIGDRTTDRAIFIKYAIVRGTGYRVGEMKLIHNGSSVYYGADNFISNGLAGVGDPGIVIDADISGDNIRLNITLDNTGSSAQFFYNLEIVLIP